MFLCICSTQEILLSDYCVIYRQYRIIFVRLILKLKNVET